MIRDPELLAPSSDVAFSPTVKAIQQARGSRAAYAAMEAKGGFNVEIDEVLAAFVAERNSFYLATASADGQPYVQHRGGPRGFLRVLGPRTLGFADFRGNRQYITLGNLADNPKAFLFLMDYAERQRVKIWGRARVVEDPAVLEALTIGGYPARVEQAILFDVDAWNGNCHQHIPVKIDALDVAPVVDQMRARIAELEAEVARLKGS